MVKNYVTATLLLLLSCSNNSSAFSFSSAMSRAFLRTNNHPQLKTLSDAFPGHVLDIRLDIGKTANDPAPNKCMTIQNLILGLEKKKGGIAANTVPMLGTNGPNPGTSGGIGNLQVLKSGHFIDLTGTVKIDFSPQANWELVWRQDSPMGSLNCGLDLKNDAVRNSAVLQKGHIDLCFNVWNTDTLRDYQERKAYVTEKASEYLQDRDDELAKYQAASNLFAKAMHYRNAVAAVEKYSLQPMRSMSQVPDTDGVIQIDDDLFLTRKGTVWSKDLGAFGKQTFLGEAVIRAPTNPIDIPMDPTTPSWSDDSIAP